MPENNDDIVVFDEEGALLADVVATLDAIPALALIAYIEGSRPDYAAMKTLTSRRYVIENTVTELDALVTGTLEDIAAACANVLTHESDKTAFDVMIPDMIEGRFLGGRTGPALASIPQGAEAWIAARQREPVPEGNDDDTLGA